MVCPSNALHGRARVGVPALRGCNLPVLRKPNVACCPRATPPDLRKIKAGTTKLNELPGSLVGFSTISPADDGLFWARWYKRVSPIGWMGTTGEDPEGQDEAYEWKLVNFVAIFDSRAVLRRYRVCSEGELIRCLQDMAAIAPEPPHQKPPQLVFDASREALTQWGTDRFHGKLTITSGGGRLEGVAGPRSSSSPPFNVSFPTAKIINIDVSHGSHLSDIRLRIRFRPDVGLDFVQVSASSAETWHLIRMLRLGTTG